MKNMAWIIIFFLTMFNHTFYALHEEPYEQKPKEYKPTEEIFRREEEIKKNNELIEQKETRLKQLKQQPTWTPINQETIVLQNQIEETKKQNKQLEEQIKAFAQESIEAQPSTSQEIKKLEESAQKTYEAGLKEEDENNSLEQWEEVIKKCIEEWLSRIITQPSTEQWHKVTVEYNEALKELMKYEYATYPEQQEWSVQQWEEFENTTLESVKDAEKKGSVVEKNQLYYSDLIKKVRFYKQQLETLTHTRLPSRPLLEDKCTQALKELAKEK